MTHNKPRRHPHAVDSKIKREMDRLAHQPVRRVEVSVNRERNVQA